jgi:hypothetical protein
MKRAEGAESSQKRRQQQTRLDRQYGEIGISAVAAAVRYQSDAKNQAYAPVIVRSDERSDEFAA